MDRERAAIGSLVSVAIAEDAKAKKANKTPHHEDSVWKQLATFTGWSAVIAGSFAIAYVFGNGETDIKQRTVKIAMEELTARRGDILEQLAKTPRMEIQFQIPGENGGASRVAKVNIAEFLRARAVGSACTPKGSNIQGIPVTAEISLVDEQGPGKSLMGKKKLCITADGVTEEFKTQSISGSLKDRAKGARDSIMKRFGKGEPKNEGQAPK